MEEVIKNLLYYCVIRIGSTILIWLLIAGLIRTFCFMLDHLKAANVLREALQLYIRTKKDKRIKEEDIKGE